MKLSKRIRDMKFSPIRYFNTFAYEAEEKGKTVYRLNIGQPDVDTPEVFFDAIRNFDRKVIEYSDSNGEPELVNAIIDYNKKYGIDITRDNIMVTMGGSEALTMVFTTILDPGDEILMAEPFYANYSTFCNQESGRIVPIKTKAENKYAWVDKEHIESFITDYTKAIMCTTPDNPTGRVLTLDQMRVICEIAEEYDLWVVCDEVYREFVYDDGKISSFGMLPEYADRVIITDSVSKRFSACGARIGCIISKNPKLMEVLQKLGQGRLCCPTLEQYGAAALYRIDDSYYEMMKIEYENRRNAVYDELTKIPGIVCNKPEGGFYITAKLPIEDAEDFLIFMLKEFDDNGETVMFAPASGFYASRNIPKNEIRIAYVLSAEKLKRCAEIIRLGLEAYKNR